jgi:hypothetical protein
VSDVQEVMPRQRRLIVGCAPERGHDRLARLRAHVSRNAGQESTKSSG